MRKQTATRVAALIALFTTSFGPALAAGPFQLRRASTAQAVSTSPAVAVFTTSPYDGEPVASGGVSYDYEVYDASGSALTISVQINPVTQTLRIAFDDGNPTSAPVNASMSSVTVVPASILADGLQLATISILPRDANGVPLGRGLNVAIDPSLLWPATLTGPVVDRGDGSYVATAVASVPGTGLVRAVVEGVSLAPSPTITVNPVDPSMSQRDLAIAELLGEVHSGGPLSTLIAEAGGSAPQLAALNGTINAINTTASMLANSDPSKDDNILKLQLGEAMTELEEVYNTPGTVNPLDVRDAMDDLLGIARLVAQWHLDQAAAACGVCATSGSGKKVCAATAALATADGMRAAVSPDWSATLDEFATVVTLALQAQQTC